MLYSFSCSKCGCTKLEEVTVDATVITVFDEVDGDGCYTPIETDYEDGEFLCYRCYKCSEKLSAACREEMIEYLKTQNNSTDPVEFLVARDDLTWNIVREIPPFKVTNDITDQRLVEWFQREFFPQLSYKNAVLVSVYNRNPEPEVL
jgi:hypothetical protein